MDYNNELKRNKVIKHIDDLKHSVNGVHKAITGISDNYWRQHLMSKFQSVMNSGNHKALTSLIEDSLKNPANDEGAIDNIKMLQSWILNTAEGQLVSICKGCQGNSCPDKCLNCTVSKFIVFKEGLSNGNK